MKRDFFFFVERLSVVHRAEYNNNNKELSFVSLATLSLNVDRDVATLNTVCLLQATRSTCYESHNKGRCFICYFLLSALFMARKLHKDCTLHRRLRPFAASS